jgi:hypothetical protein
MRYQVASVVAGEPMVGSDVHVSNLLSLTHDEFVEDFQTPGINILRVVIQSDWDGSAGGGGYGGSRNVSLVPEPFMAA